jgi:hypothetical protein
MELIPLRPRLRSLPDRLIIRVGLRTVQSGGLRLTQWTAWLT